METMTSRERLLTALKGSIPDRLPVTTHHVQPYFLDKYMGGITGPEFYDRFGFDPTEWVFVQKPSTADEYFDPEHEHGLFEATRISSDNWRIHAEVIGQDSEYTTTRYSFVTPKKTLTTVLKSAGYTSWIIECLVKEKSDIDIIGEYCTTPACDVDAVNRQVDKAAGRGLVRSHVPYFDVYGQPGCWQDAACLYGIQELILETYDDPQWVHAFLNILQERKKVFLTTSKGAKYDLLELGGGHASSTVISPKIFDEFVAPYDGELIELAHEAGQRIVYHTCGGMMAFLERIADMNPDAMETFTPKDMGGDAILSEAKRRIGDRVCMIGGFDQFHYLVGCTPEETRAAVRRCFEEAGQNGGYILSPSDHFFDADLKLLEAFADEARKCRYWE